MKTEAQIRQQYEQLEPSLTEPSKREWAGTEAMALGHGGIGMVFRATGIVPSTIGKAIGAFRQREAGVMVRLPRQRVRRLGNGRKTKLASDPTLPYDFSGLVEPATRGDPESPLQWISKSLRNLKSALLAKGHTISHRTVGTILKQGAAVEMETAEIRQ